VTTGDAVRWCPACGAGYGAPATACAACRVALVDEPPGVDDDEVEGVAFDLADWSPELRAQLEERLEGEGIAWAWEDDELVVEVGDDDRVEVLIEELDFPDALDPEAAGEDDDGAAEVMSTLFVAADRLSGDPTASTAVVEAIEAAESAGALDAPYGVDAAAWSGVVERAQVLAEALGGDTEDEVVVAAARALRDALRPYV
jgi:hypothetical protein